MLLICFILYRIPSCLLFGVNLRLLEIITKNSTLFTKMMSNDRMRFIYIYFNLGGIDTCVTISAGDDLLLVFLLVILGLYQVCAQIP